MGFRWRRGKQRCKNIINNKAQHQHVGSFTLDALNEGEMAVIASVPPTPLLAALGLRPGKKVLLHAKERFCGPVIIEVEGRSVALGRGLCSKIQLDTLEAAKNA